MWIEAIISHSDWLLEKYNRLNVVYRSSLSTYPARSETMCKLKGCKLELLTLQKTRFCTSFPNRLITVCLKRKSSPALNYKCNIPLTCSDMLEEGFLFCRK